MRNIHLILNASQTNPMEITLGDVQNTIGVNFSTSSPTPITLSPLVVGKRGENAHVSPLYLTLPVADWSGNTIEVDAEGVTTSNFLIVSPSPESQTNYIDSGVMCWSQGTDSLVFKCDSTPTVELYVNVGVFL